MKLTFVATTMLMSTALAAPLPQLRQAGASSSGLSSLSDIVGGILKAPFAILGGDVQGGVSSLGAVATDSLSLPFNVLGDLAPLTSGLLSPLGFLFGKGN